MPKLWKEPLDQVDAARLRAEQFSAIARHTPGMMLANVCNALVLVIAFLGTPRFVAALYWAAAVSSLAGYIYYRRRRRLWTASARTTHASGGAQRAVVYALALGSCWAALPLFFFDGASSGAQLLIVCLCAGMLCGGVFALASVPVAALSFAAPIVAASFVVLLRGFEKERLLIALVLVVYATVLLRGVYIYAEQLRNRVLTQIDIEQRARLRLEKLRATGLDAVGGMVTGFAHEINQPLSAAATYVNTAQRLLRMSEKERPSDASDALDQASAQIARAGQIVAHLRDFIISGEPDKTFLNLHEAIAEACQTAAEATRRGEIEVSLKLGASDDRVLADKVQIRQVLGNLIRNAVDAMKGSALRELTISTSMTDEGSIRTDVADTGAGLPPAIQADLFQPFTTTKAGGMGVGLSISHTIIDAHYGRLWAEPNPGGGAIFSFTLPLAEAAAAGS